MRKRLLAISTCSGDWQTSFPPGWICWTKDLFNVALRPLFTITATTKPSPQRRPVYKKSGKGPIIIIGHSLGADAAIFMAEKMKAAGARVALVVTVGPTMNLTAPSNVSQVVNYYTGNTLVTRGSGFKGTISNVNLNAAPDINHLNIEKSNRLHASVISKIQTIAGHGHLGRAAVVQ
jgi:hypothetical protein